MSEAPRTPVNPRNTVRLRLLIIALLPILILLPLFLATTVTNWKEQLNQVLTAKVSNELTVARQHLNGLTERRSAAISALARSAEFRKLMNDTAVLSNYLEGQRIRLGFDFLYYVTPDGNVVQGGSYMALPDQRNWPVVNAALNGQMRAAIDVMNQRDMLALSPAMASRAAVELIATQGAAPSTRTEETRGMVVHAAAPAPGGAVVGGLLLNRNLGFIDEINDLVYPEGSLTGGGLGTATLFLDDVRVSTNVRLFEGVRAIGTRVSEEVRDKVLDGGSVWTARAFVVNDWYISAYEPITDSFGRRIGMLYVGFLEEPFRKAEQRTHMIIWASFLVVILVSVPVLLRFARGIFKPLERMNRTIARVESGNLGARSGIGGRDDEISRLAAHLDSLLDQIQERDQRLRTLNEELEKRVDARTQDLQEANRQLEITSRQLILSEKLAAVGELTAGVAHEINNPLAVIQGNLDVISDELGPNAKPFATEFSLIQEQIQAISLLGTKLLKFTRPEEFDAPEHGLVPDAVVRATLPLVQHVMARAGVEVVLDLQAGGEVAMNETELQQVVVNLMVNAAQAMPDGGHLYLRSYMDEGWARPLVVLEVRDTGKGMSGDVQKQIFEPFFTTKKSEGTGLGLSITRDLVRRAGGSIHVESAEGQGTVFTLRLPVMDEVAP